MSLHPPAFIKLLFSEHGLLWHGISLLSVWKDCPGCVCSQLLVPPQLPVHHKPAGECTVREGENLDVVGTLLKTWVCDQQSPQNPKHSMTLGCCEGH